MARSKKPTSPDAEIETETMDTDASVIPGDSTDRPETEAPLMLTEPVPDESTVAEPEPDTAESSRVRPVPDAPETVEELSDPASPPAAEDLPEPEKAAPADKPAPVSPQPSGSGGGFAGGLFGGALVALAAVGAVYVANPSVFQDRHAPDLSAAVATVEARIETEAERVATLTEEVASLRETVASADTSALTGQIAGIEDAVATRLEAFSADLESIQGALAGLDTRLMAAESRPAADGSAPVDTSAYESELAELRAAVEAQNAAAAQMASDLERVTGEAEARLAALASEAQAMQVEAAEAARAATARAALSLVQAALEGGGPFDGPLADFAAAQGSSPPDPLASVAATGVPTLPDLLRTFPEAARSALDASIRARLDASEGTMDRVFAFLQSQSGARSLEPREGDDPDAVLSRAEAALREGRLADVLALVDALPEPGQAALASWRDGAAQRAVALEAAAGLAAALATN